MKRRARNTLVFLGVTLILLLGTALILVPGFAADAIIHPWRKVRTSELPRDVGLAQFSEGDRTLAGWHRKAAPDVPFHGTIIYLHGIADNSESGFGVGERFAPLGWNVLAYDHRAHGNSFGDTCTFGVLEKEDLRKVIRLELDDGPVVLIGSSLGGAIALQTVAEYPDLPVRAVVAAEVFSDLRTVARDRAPAILPDFLVDRTLQLAGERGQFPVEEASSVKAAKKIRVPVFVIHGADDIDTPPEHSQRIYDALGGPKKLLLVPGATHNHSLNSGQTWDLIQAWIHEIVDSSETAAPSNP